MKIIKKFVILFTLLLCLYPCNTLKAEDGITPTEAAYICTKCGNTLVNISKAYTGSKIYRSVHCVHYPNGFDHEYHYYFSYVGSCTNCGNQLNDPNHMEIRIVCDGNY